MTIRRTFAFHAMSRILAFLLAIFTAPRLASAIQTPDPPSITAVVPALAYPNGSGRGTLVITGVGFAGQPVILLNGEPVDADWTGKDPAKIWATAAAADQVRLSNIPMWDRRGPIKVRLRVGATLTNEVTATLAGVGRWTPLALASVATLALIALVGAVVCSRKVRGLGTRLKLLPLLLLDPETDTYSLSRFQFYAWTFAAVFGYLYLAVVWSLVRAKFSLPPIPQNFPGVVLLSAATSVVATGITSARGPKGSGDVHPSPADLVSTGAVVAPERVQFFVWTVLGVVCFLFVSVMSDPANLDALPEVPQEFLSLGGVSAFGYLGGKLARKAGPVLDDCVASLGSLKVRIIGRNLSPRASILVGNVPIAYDPAEGPRGGVSLGATLRSLQAEERNPDLASTLELSIDAPRPEWIAALRQHAGGGAEASGASLPVLTLVNPDGQRASWPIRLAPAAEPVPRL